MVSAIVVDDEWYNLEEVADLLEKTNCMEVKRKYQNPIIALSEFAEINPDVAFVDVDMPEIDGTTLATKFIEINPSVLIVFITAWKQYAAEAFDLDAVDYIIKPIRIERFNQMIEKVKAKVSSIKEKHICTDILSIRETEVLNFISLGLTQEQIAKELFISISTVKRYVESIYLKLDVNNKISAIKKAEALNIL